MHNTHRHSMQCSGPRCSCHFLKLIWGFTSVNRTHTHTQVYTHPHSYIIMIASTHPDRQTHKNNSSFIYTAALSVYFSTNFFVTTLNDTCKVRNTRSCVRIMSRPKTVTDSPITTNKHGVKVSLRRGVQHACKKGVEVKVSVWS